MTLGQILLAGLDQLLPGNGAPKHRRRVALPGNVDLRSRATDYRHAGKRRKPVRVSFAVGGAFA